MSYHAERKLLQIQNGKLHYQIWRLGREKETEDQVSRLKTELEENAIRITPLPRASAAPLSRDLFRQPPSAARGGPLGRAQGPSYFRCLYVSLSCSLFSDSRRVQRCSNAVLNKSCCVLLMTMFAT